MSFRLRAAIVAAFALSAAAAMSASEMSIAGESIASVTSLPKTVPAATQPAVVFAAPRETAQPLDSYHVAGSSSSSDSDFSATSLAALVDAQGAPEELDGDMQCLAGAVYFESKGESLEGQLAVARVIINRAKSGRFADSLCGVIYQPSQFSFVRRCRRSAWKAAAGARPSPLRKSRWRTAGTVGLKVRSSSTPAAFRRAGAKPNWPRSTIISSTADLAGFADKAKD